MKKASVVMFVLGGVSALTLLGGANTLSIVAAALFTAVGGALLVINAIMHPESIKTPEVKVPEIHVHVPKVHVNKN
jgi:hypothetical protein